MYIWKNVLKTLEFWFQSENTQSLFCLSQEEPIVSIYFESSYYTSACNTLPITEWMQRFTTVNG